MRDIFRVMWAGVQDFWDELFLLALMNIVTMLLAIPVITFPPVMRVVFPISSLPVPKDRLMR